MSLEKYLHRNSVSSNKNSLGIRESTGLDTKARGSKKRISKDRQNILHIEEEYETDIRNRVASEADLELLELRKLVAACEHCRKKLPQFMTKKHKDTERGKKSESVQTQSNTALFYLLEQKLQQIQRCNGLVIKDLQMKDRQLELKEQQLVEIQERFTRLIYKVSEDVFLAQRIQKQYSQMKAYSRTCEDIPSYLKCLTMDEYVRGCPDADNW